MNTTTTTTPPSTNDRDPMALLGLSGMQQPESSPLVRYVTLRICVSAEADGLSEFSELLDALQAHQQGLVRAAADEPMDEQDRRDYERLDLLRQNLTRQVISQLVFPAARQ